jgi:hypothetical protein
VIYTANYGEAGAINELGRADGLPTAVSGHNTDWWWGPGNLRATTVIVVAPGDAPLVVCGRRAAQRRVLRQRAERERAGRLTARRAGTQRGPR